MQEQIERTNERIEEGFKDVLIKMDAIKKEIHDDKKFKWLNLRVNALTIIVICLVCVIFWLVLGLPPETIRQLIMHIV